MFGYIRPRIDELKVRQEAEYRAAYCGLCRCLGKRHGLIARFLVNYDITFAWLLIAGHGELSPCSRQFCPANPLKKKACRAMDPAMEYCADLCVILCAASLRDRQRDEKGLRKLPPALACAALRSANRRACESRPALAELTRTQLDKLGELEAAKCDSMDRAADAFASLLSHCADDAVEGELRPVQQLLYHVGRFIYLADALDDLKSDAASGDYNPLLFRFSCPGGDLSEDDRAYVRKSILASVSMARAALALCDLRSNREILENIVSLGMPAVLDAVDRGTFQSKRKMKDTGVL